MGKHDSSLDDGCLDLSKLAQPITRRHADLRVPSTQEHGQETLQRA